MECRRRDENVIDLKFLIMNTSVASTGSAVPIGFRSFAADGESPSKRGPKESVNVSGIQEAEISFADSEKQEG